MGDKASFLKRQDGSAIVFETTPASPPKYWFLLVLGVLMGYLNIGSGGVLGAIFWVLAALAVWGCFRDPRPKSLRGPARLRFENGELVTTSGKRYRYDEIKSIALENLIDLDGPGMLVGGKDISVKRRQKMNAVSWYLHLEKANGESFNIAGGLDHETASELLRAIGEVVTGKASATSAGVVTANLI